MNLNKKEKPSKDMTTEQALFLALKKALDNPLSFGKFTLEIIYFNTKVTRFETSWVESHLVN